MSKVAGCIVAALVLLVSSIHVDTVAQAQDIEAVASAAKSSVAVILAQRPDGNFSGTAFMAAEHLVLTANHVVKGATRVLLKFPDYPAVDARVVASEANDDVAVLTIPSLPVRPLPLGDIGQVHEGQAIVVIGFPRVEALGIETATVTTGIISAIRPGVLQMQAPISPGNSGGPVLSLRGEVVGIVSATLKGQQQGLNFATTINAAKPLLGAAVLTPSPGPPSSPVTISQPSAQQPVNEFLVVPGQSIGRIRIGMSLDDVTAILGQYTDKVEIGGYDVHQSINYWWRHSPGSIGVQTRKDNLRVLMVMAELDERYGLEGGRAHVGISEATLTSVMGPPQQTFRYQTSHSLVYPKVAFRVWDASNNPKFAMWAGKVYLIQVASGFKVTF